MKLSNIYSRYLLLAISAVLVFSGCNKEDKNNPNGTNNGSGRFSGHKTCTIIAPPAGVSLDNYYKKYLNCSGIPVISNGNVPDEALFDVDDLVEFMLQGKEEIRNTLINEGAYIAIADGNETALRAMPEVITENPGTVNTGIYMSRFPIAITNVNNVLCTRDNEVFGESTTIHEFAHMIHLSALVKLYPGFQAELDATYNAAIKSGLWANTYAATKSAEYLATGITRWYGVHVEGGKGGDGTNNEIFSREGLKSYDRGLYDLIEKYFNADIDVPGCVKPVTSINKPCVSTVTDIDGNVYDVVSIGGQCWMKQNLKTSRFRDGTEITEVTNITGWQNLADGTTVFAYYDHDKANEAKYGKMYNWQVASDPRLCPNGWHIPSLEEVDQLFKQVGGKAQSGALMSTTGWDNNPGATNSSGFSLLPGGILYQGGFEGKGVQAFLWTTRGGFNNDFTIAAAAELKVGTPSTTNMFPKNSGIPCRCVMD